MNPEIKADWLTALRSGEYRQGKGFLKYQAGEKVSYCCLGVLCELAVKAGVIAESESDADEFVHDFMGSSTYLPAAVEEWADINARGRKYSDSGERVLVDLADLNDYKMTFTGIADVIEEEF